MRLSGSFCICLPRNFPQPVDEPAHAQADYFVFISVVLVIPGNVANSDESQVIHKTNASQ